MSDQEQPRAKSHEKVWYVSSKGRPEIYTNIFYIHWTLVDVRIRLGLIIPDATKAPDFADWEVEELGAVTMSWDQAKALQEALAEAVRRYEKSNGAIVPKKLPVE